MTESGDAAWNGPENFGQKIKEIDRKQIKHITFGPDDTWAITMMNGHCHYCAFKGPKGPSSAIEEHQDNIWNEF